MFSVSDVEDLICDRFPRRLEHGDDGLANVEPVHNRAPGCTVTGHSDLLGCPSESGQVVQNDVKSHPRRSTIRRGVPHEGRRELFVREDADIALNQRFAYSIRGLWIDWRFLGYKIPT